jgi:hypothetical protein
MKTSIARLVALLCLSPAAVVAHPGHLDGAPLAHALLHGAFYLLALTALCLLVKQHGKAVWRTIYDRKRPRRH